MFVLAVVFTIFVCVHGAVLPSISKLNGRVEGGEIVSIEDAPFQVSLLQDQGTGNYLHVCGGFIITENSVLSAAQCTHGTSLSQWKIRAGSARHDRGGEVFEVSRFVQHPDFNDRMENDIVLLSTSSNFIFWTTMAYITLPRQGEEVFGGFTGYSFGWGSSNENDTSLSQLRALYTLSIYRSECKDHYTSIKAVTENMVCTRESFCRGDIGGPLVMNAAYQAVGIMSWSNGYRGSGDPGVYTRVSMYIRWINSLIT